jgi:hypothetical protein
VARQNDGNDKLQGLAEQIAAAEAGLRRHFENTPGLSPEALARIKAEVWSESARLGLARGTRHRQFLRIAAIAAAVLIAVGGGLYFVALQPGSHVGPSTTAVPGPGMQASRDTESLDAFTASLSKVMSDENPAVGELNSDLQDLESEHRSNG